MYPARAFDASRDDGLRSPDRYGSVAQLLRPEVSMPLALNLTAPLKQDSGSQRTIAEFAASFDTLVQPRMETELEESDLVHFARVLVISDPPRYLQILTEFDGDPLLYTEFFRLELGDIFKQVFALVEGAPPWEELNNKIAFYNYTQSLNLPALGTSV